MEAELAALAASGATTLIGLMATEAWTQARDRVAGFFSRGREEELDLSRAELVAAREAGDDQAVADVEAEWRTRLRRRLQADPEAAAELRLLLDELTPQLPAQQVRDVRNTVSGGVQHGPVIQAGTISGLTFGGPV